MILIPYKLDTTFTRIPYTNAVLIVLYIPHIFSSRTSISDGIPESVGPSRLGNSPGLVGKHVFTWRIVSFAGEYDIPLDFRKCNLLYCREYSYGFLYLCLGVVAAAAHLSFDAHPAIGASGAINGIVGMALFFFPRNKIHVWYLFPIPFVWIFKIGTFAVSTYWMVLYWLVFDILGSMGSPDGIAHWMHLGGFAGGIIIAMCALKFNLVELHNLSLLDIFAGRKEEDELWRTNAIEQQVAVAVPAGFIAPQLDEASDPFSAASATTANNAPSVSAVPPPRPVPKVPDIQLKKCIGNETLITLYIVNNGASMNSLRLKVPQGVTAQISQTKNLRQGESVWIRLIPPKLPSTVSNLF